MPIHQPLVVGVTPITGKLQRPHTIPDEPTRTAVELRLDIGAGWHTVLNDPDKFADLIDWFTDDIAETSPPPLVIATCRRKQDGGEFNGDESQRLQILEMCGKLCDFVDVESGVTAKVPEARTIRSFHDFKGVPDFDVVANDLALEGGAIYKIVGTAKRLSDNLAVREFLQDRLDATAFLMGEYGLPSRVLALSWGSRMTYGSLTGGAIAPGMVDFQRLVNLYQAQEIDAAFELFGITGKHVSHSLSPAMHNIALKTLQRRAVYLPLAAADVQDFVQFARGVKLTGASVTVPFKEEIVARCSKLDEITESIGAANTLISLDSGGYRGRNTDVPGFVEDLKIEYNRPLFGRKALVLGAGGAARAVVYGLRREGVAVDVWSRNPEQATELCGSLGGNAVSTLGGKADLLINATPCGMQGEHAGEIAMPWQTLEPHLAHDALVYDLVYEPEATPLLKLAKQAKLQTVNGLGMLRRQAALQAKIFGYRLLFDVAEPPKHNEHIWLVGYRGAGKSALARELAIKLRRRAVDTDKQIELVGGASIAEVFKSQGEDAFRLLEIDAVAKAAAAIPDAVIAVGGGAVERPENIRAMRASGTVIFLDVPVDALVTRLSADDGDRPSLTGRDVAEEVAEVLARRMPLYERAAHIVFEVEDKPIRELAGEITSKLAEFRSK